MIEVLVHFINYAHNYTQNNIIDKMNNSVTRNKNMSHIKNKISLLREIEGKGTWIIIF